MKVLACVLGTIALLGSNANGQAGLSPGCVASSWRALHSIEADTEIASENSGEASKAATEVMSKACESAEDERIFLAIEMYDLSRAVDQVNALGGRHHPALLNTAQCGGAIRRDLKAGRALAEIRECMAPGQRPIDHHR